MRITRWGGKQGRPQQQQKSQQQQQQLSSCTRSSSKFGGWMSKLKQSLVGKANAIPKQGSTSEGEGEGEVDRNTVRVMTASDIFPFNHSILGHFIAGEDLAPPRHSYHGGDGEVPCFDCKRRRRRERTQRRGGSGNFGEKESGYEPDPSDDFGSDLQRSRSERERFDVYVPDNERSKIDGNLTRSNSKAPASAPELKPIRTSIVDGEYPDQDPVVPFRIRKPTAGKTRRKGKVRVNSPRLKVSKLEASPRSSSSSTTRKTRLRKLESFAVAKCSVDPHRDFRDSMVEMILEKRIVRPEELEGLLACYLSLNSCEYHDIIVKVFRQVWFELNTKTASTEKRRPNTIKRRSSWGPPVVGL